MEQQECQPHCQCENQVFQHIKLSLLAKFLILNYLSNWASDSNATESLLEAGKSKKTQDP